MFGCDQVDHLPVEWEGLRRRSALQGTFPWCASWSSGQDHGEWLLIVFDVFRTKPLRCAVNTSPDSARGRSASMSTHQVHFFPLEGQRFANSTPGGDHK
jgi:hypothetical protein